MIRRRSVVGALLACSLVAGPGRARAAEPFTLITQDDVQAERKFESRPDETSAANTRALTPPADQSKPPFIKVVAPNMNAEALASPIRIELTFDTASDAHVVPDSFKVLYGLLKIDITSKIRPYAKINEHGLVADNAAIPTGSHRLFLQISDSAGRTAVRELRFTVDR